MLNCFADNTNHSYCWITCLNIQLSIQLAFEPVFSNALTLIYTIKQIWMSHYSTPSNTIIDASKKNKYILW